MNPAQRWKCVSIGDGSWGVTLGVVYNVDEAGKLIKNGGLPGTYPSSYNAAGRNVAKFVCVKQAKNMVNK